jgi:hypothetical protein
MQSTPPDTSADKFTLVSMGAERRAKRVQTHERGPPSATPEKQIFFCLIHLCIQFLKSEAPSATPEKQIFFSLILICKQFLKSEFLFKNHAKADTKYIYFPNIPAQEHRIFKSLAPIPHNTNTHL